MLISARVRVRLWEIAQLACGDQIELLAQQPDIVPHVEQLPGFVGAALHRQHVFETGMTHLGS